MATVGPRGGIMKVLIDRLGPIPSLHWAKALRAEVSIARLKPRMSRMGTNERTAVKNQCLHSTEGENLCPNSWIIRGIRVIRGSSPGFAVKDQWPRIGTSGIGVQAPIRASPLRPP